MKKNKWILFVVMLITIVTMPMTANAAKVKLNKKKATITVGSTVLLTVNGTQKRVKWSSSNNKVATVSKKGKVKGKKVGKAIITAKIGKKKLKCKITVKKDNSKGKKPQFSTNHIKLNLRTHTSDLVKITNMSSAQMKKVKIWMADEDKEEIDKGDVSFTVSGNTITVNAKNPGVFYLYASYGKKSYGAKTGRCIVTIDGLDLGGDVIYDGVVYEQDSISQAQYGNLLCMAYPETYGVFRNRYLSKCRTELAKILCTHKFFVDNNYQYSTTVCGGPHFFNTYRIGKCTDYADETYNLCCIAGIPVESVYSSDLNHMWNQVYLGGAWCPLDNTSNILGFNPISYHTTIPDSMVCRGTAATGNLVTSKKGYELVVNGLRIDLSKCVVSLDYDRVALQVFPKLELKEQLSDRLENGKYVFYDLKNDFVGGIIP